ncbi:hypothetical protein EAI_05939 [Harpegnathos saltator]|uniref:Uncharacterized protein n=1 Tax=Harpegnathos saltator TaxID=610380 RepID=E2BVY4_HARSA|nr:hypothetical protein EAI_05939 [Harpegnathos saltator]
MEETHAFHRFRGSSQRIRQPTSLPGYMQLAAWKPRASCVQAATASRKYATHMWVKHIALPLYAPTLTLTRKYPGQPRSRSAGGAPIYGKMVHKAPAGSRLRNGMRQRARNLEDMRLFGTVNRYIPSNRHQHVTSFRVGGGVSSPRVPQAGSFEALKNLVQAERARELREQHIEEIVAEAALKERAREEEEQEANIQQSRGQYSNPLPPLQIPKEYYDYNNRRYMSNVPNNGQAWSVNVFEVLCRLCKFGQASLLKKRFELTSRQRFADLGL